MKKIHIFLGFVLIVLILNSMIVHAEGAIKIPLNSTKIIEPIKETKKSMVTDQAIKMIAFDEKEFLEKADEELINKLGKNYFEEHYEYEETKVMNIFICIKYKYNYKIYDVNMLICYNSREKELNPSMSSILDYPQEINFDEKDALQKADDLELSFERDIKLVYDSSYKTLAWKIVWDHEPTQEEKIQEVIKGYTFSVEDGEILRIHKFALEPIGEPDLTKDEETKSIEKITIIQKIKNFFNNFLKWFKD